MQIIYDGMITFTIYKQTLRISGVTVLGPLEEKAAMDGAGLALNLPTGGIRVPIGVLS